MTTARCQGGFTLLEILVALAVFAILSMMAYSGLAAILDAQEATRPRSAQLAQLQSAWYFLNEDLSLVVDRPIRDELGSQEPAFSNGRGNEILVFTRTAPTWFGDAGNTLQRISYRLEKGALYRQVWGLLDRTPETQYRRKKLITTDLVEINFYDDKTQSWLPYTSTNGTIPKALAISIKLADLGMVRRLFLIR